MTEELEERGFKVFLPQRDGVEPGKPPYNEMICDELCQSIFVTDRDKVLKADIFLFVLDGRVPDEGACVELSIAYGQKHLLQRDKLLIGLQTDIRCGVAILGGTRCHIERVQVLNRILRGIHCSSKRSPKNLHLH